MRRTWTAEKATRIVTVLSDARELRIHELTDVEEHIWPNTHVSLELGWIVARPAQDASRDEVLLFGPFSAVFPESGEQKMGTRGSNGTSALTICPHQWQEGEPQCINSPMIRGQEPWKPAGHA
jgi:hypothetical protein